MHLRAPAIILSARGHGEHGSVVRALTREDGVQPGYVRGGRSRAFRPVLMAGNLIVGEWRARTADQLPALTVEPVHSYGVLHAEPLAAAAIEWVTAATAAALPEAQAYPRLHDALAGVLAAIEAAPTARGWAVALVRYELLLLGELGFGLDLTRCTVSGHDAPRFVSPRTGGAVGAAEAVGYEARLMPIPGFLRGKPLEAGSELIEGLRLTGHFLERDVLTERRANVLAARERLVERLTRAVA